MTDEDAALNTNAEKEPRWNWWTVGTVVGVIVFFAAFSFAQLLCRSGKLPRVYSEKLSPYLEEKLSLDDETDFVRVVADPASQRLVGGLKISWLALFDMPR